MSLHQQQQQQASTNSSSSLPPTRSAKTQSLPRSGSGLFGSSVGEQLGSAASGYVATGSENSIDNGSMSKKSSSQTQELPTTASVAVASSFPATGTAKSKDSDATTTTTGNSSNGTHTVPITQAQMEVLNHQPSQANSQQLSYPLQKLLAQPLSFDIENDNLDELLDPQHGVNFHQHGNVYYHSHPHSHSNQLYHQHVNSRTRGGTVPANFQQSQRGLHRSQVPHHSLNLDRIQLPNHTLNHVSFNPGRSVRTSPGLPSISAAVPRPPPHFGGIKVDIDV